MSQQRPQDRDTINKHLVDIVESYLGPPMRTEGSRRVYRCPSCQSDNLHANPDYEDHPIIGCFKAECSVERVMNAIEFVALQEDLDMRKDFRKVCKLAAQRIPATAGADDDSQSTLQTTGVSGEKPSGEAQERTRAELRELRHEVFERLLGGCSLNPRARSFLHDRGLNEDTITAGRFGFFRKSRGKEVLQDLCRHFGERILEVPGFATRGERVSFTLMGHDWLLIPYLDREGYITNIEGRIMPEEEGQVKCKYLSLRNSGSHLYLFPGMDFDNIEAFCEGVFGAVLAAQQGVAVGSIKGFRCYRGSRTEVLEELRGVDFAGRKVVYIPDVDDPPNPEVMNEAPVAARWLIEAQNGVAGIARLPGSKDLDEYLLTLPSSSGVKAIRELVAASESLEDFEASTESGAPQNTEGGGASASSRSRPSPEQNPSSGESPGLDLDEEMRQLYREYTEGGAQSGGEASVAGAGEPAPETEAPSAGDSQGSVSAEGVRGEGEATANTQTNGKANGSANGHSGGQANGSSGDARRAVKGPPMQSGAHAGGASSTDGSGSEDSRNTLRHKAGGVLLWTVAGRLLRPPSAEEVVDGLWRRMKLLAAAVFVAVLSALLWGHAGALLSALTPLAGMPATLLALALAAAVPVGALLLLRRRRRRHELFLSGRWIPGEKTRK